VRAGGELGAAVSRRRLERGGEEPGLAGDPLQLVKLPAVKGAIDDNLNHLVEGRGEQSGMLVREVLSTERADRGAKGIRFAAGRFKSHNRHGTVDGRVT